MVFVSKDHYVLQYVDTDFNLTLQSFKVIHVSRLLKLVISISKGCGKKKLLRHAKGVHWSLMGRWGGYQDRRG